MLLKPLSRRLLLKLSIVSAICLITSDARSGDFRYEPQSQENWPANLVRSVQNRLKELGFNPGASDGIYGQKTKNAIMEYQRSKNMEPDGKISNKLLGELGLG